MTSVLDSDTLTDYVRRHAVLPEACGTLADGEDPDPTIEFEEVAPGLWAPVNAVFVPMGRA